MIAGKEGGKREGAYFFSLASLIVAGKGERDTGNRNPPRSANKTAEKESKRHSEKAAKK